MKILHNKIALVTGASRGVGKGIAMSLAMDGASVYITGRTEHQADESAGLPGTIYETEAQIVSKGGKCTAIRCDHINDQEVVDVFHQIFTKHDRLDILVNSVWEVMNTLMMARNFGQKKDFGQLQCRVGQMFSSGVRAAYLQVSSCAKNG